MTDADYVDVNIQKPLYDNFVYIRDKYVIEAMKYHKRLRITIPQGTFVMSVLDFMTKAKKLEKEFLIPGKPMKLYGNYVRNSNLHDD